jgi:rod shape-determining protein MreC
VGLALLSLVLMFADSRFDYLGRVRYYIAIIVTPLHLIADLPTRASEAFHSFFRTREELEADNQRLQDEMLMLQFKLQKFDHLEAENQRLDELLKASATVDDSAVRAQLIGESSDPFSKRVIINKGSNEGVYVGQPVVDAHGLVGQVMQVEPLLSWVLLITDPLHNTPVQVNRNGVRAIAAGTPDSLHQLMLENVSPSADIKVGDELVTSGLDQRLPAGYPVGVVISVKNDGGSQSFANIRLTPAAQLDRSRNVLLLYGSPEAKAARAALKNGVAVPLSPEGKQ